MLTRAATVVLGNTHIRAALVGGRGTTLHWRKMNLKPASRMIKINLEPIPNNDSFILIQDKYCVCTRLFPASPEHLSGLLPLDSLPLGRQGGLAAGALGQVVVGVEVGLAVSLGALGPH